MRDARVGFSPYDVAYRDRCLEVFDANCPEFFAPNERVDYVDFLDRSPAGYEVRLGDGELAGAFGLIVTDEWADGARDLRLHWILSDPAVQGGVSARPSCASWVRSRCGGRRMGGAPECAA